MRINLIALIIFIAFINVSASVNGQTINLKVKELPMSSFFDAIKKQSGYGFWYEKNTIKNAMVTLDVSHANLRDVLDASLGQQNLTYTIVDHTIFVKKKELTLLDKVGNYFQDIIITGKVIDEKGVPVPGANVKLKGTNKTVVTNSNGLFRISVPKPGSVIQVIFIGYQTYEYAANASTDLNIILKENLSVLDEVQVVSNGYETISKERATGAYGVITNKELKEVPAMNILEKAEGKIPGVKFDIRGNTVQIRTVNTYSTNTAPLIVIDGFPLIEAGDSQRLTTVQNTTMANSSILTSFNSADIEQITFLKDAVATSIWGSKGANGVIVITTKKGKKGTATINLSSTFGISKAPALSKLRWMNSAQYADLETEMVNKNFITDATTQPGYNPLLAANPSEVQEWLFKVKRGQATAEQANAAIAEISTRNNQSQIQDYLLQTAVNQQQNLSISGGSDNSTYYVSANYNNDVPIYKSNKANNIILTTNLTNNLFNNRVKLRTGITYAHSKSVINTAAVEALGLNATSLRPYDMLVDANGNRVQRSVTLRPEVEAGLVAKGYLPFSYNAIDELNYGNTTPTSNQLRLNGGLNVKIINWINADISGAYQKTINNSVGIAELQSYSTRLFVNTGTTLSAAGRPVYNVPNGGIYTLRDASAYDYSIRGQLNFNPVIDSDHQITGLAGAEIREAYNKSYGSTQYGYDPDANSFAVINPTTPYTTMYGWTQTIGNPLTGVSEQKNRYLSYYGNAFYSYKNRYTLSASARFDDYTLLGVERSKRAKPFWSAGFKWSSKQEDFLQQIDWLNSLDLRLSYGTGGSVPKAGNNIPIISINATDPNTLQPIASISSPANRDLGWETTKTFNTGVDFSLFNQRLSGSFDIYDKRSFGIITLLPYNATYGWSTLSYNTGKLRSNGFEFGITGKILNTDDWGIRSTFNFSYTHTKVTDNRFNNVTGTTLTQNAGVLNGYPVGATFVYRSAGLDPLTGQTQIYDRNNQIIKNTTNLTAAFDINDVKYVGVKAAPYYGGFFNSFRYKSLELGVQTTYYFGHIFIKPSINNYPTAAFYSGVLGRQEDLSYRWRQTGDEATTNVPGLTGVNANSITRYRYSDQLVRSANNIRLQQISLSYTFAASILPKNVFKSLSVGGSARNLGMIWDANKEGLDPEYLNANANYYSMPPSKSFLFNINVSF